MSEAVVTNSATLSVNSGRPTADPDTGELVGGLAGLRELIRLKQEQSNNSNTPKSNTPSKKRRRRSRRNSSISASKLARVNVPAVELPFTAEQVVYGEIVRRNGAISDARLFVADNSRLLVYGRSVYGDKGDQYCQAAIRLIDDGTFAAAATGCYSIFVRPQDKLTGNDDGLVYDHKYQISIDDNKVLEVAKKLLKQDKPTAAVQKEQIKLMEAPKEEVVTAVRLGNLMNSTKKDKRARQTKGEQADPSDNHELRADLISKVLKVQQIVKHTEEAQSVEPADAMAVCLTLGEASAKLLGQIFTIDKDKAEQLIDQLRLMRALGECQSDKTYPILINSLTDLGRDTGYMLESQADNFRSAVHTETVRGKKLVYDLAELTMVKMADEFMVQLAEFCRVSPSRYIKKLFAEADNEVRASQVLTVVSSDDVAGGLNVADYELFHQYVTKYMLAAGWLIDKPQGGFPWLLFQLDDINGLKLDVLRYLLNNLTWLAAAYRRDSLLSLSDQVNELELPADYYGARQLKDVLSAQLNEAITKLAQEQVVDDDQMRITTKATTDKDSK